MHFSIFATILAIAATLAIAIPVDTTALSTTVAPVGEPAKPEHSGLTLKTVNEEKQKAQIHHKADEKLEKKEEEEEVVAKHQEHQEKDHHSATLVRRDFTLDGAKESKKIYKAIENAHKSAAGNSLTNAEQTDGEAQDEHRRDAKKHSRSAAKARHLSEAYGHIETAIGHENKAARASTNAKRARHLQDARDSYESAENSFKAAKAIRGGF
ncbi:hypothetical protein FRC17_002985 [Serendipita sp. 399]|nr:hypothetical protein FRC17_002985 [Serendipita sp. 399]